MLEKSGDGHRAKSRAQRVGMRSPANVNRRPKRSPKLAKTARQKATTSQKEKRKEVRSRPISRVLSKTAIPLGLASPQGSSNLPGNDAGRVIVPLFGLAPGGVCRATRRWPRARCALTAPFHPYHARLATPFGGLFSVALSVGSHRPGVTWHLALWSPDFPPRRERRGDCLADSARAG